MVAGCRTVDGILQDSGISTARILAGQAIAVRAKTKKEDTMNTEISYNLTATFPAALLAAVAAYMSKHDIRYSLNGMLLERTRVGHMRAVATDGHAFCIAVHDRCNVPETWEPIVIHRTLVEAVLKVAKLDADVSLTVNGESAKSCETLASVDSATLACPAVDRSFPDYRAWVSTEYEGMAHGMVDAAHFTRFGEQSKALKKAGAGVKYSSVLLLGLDTKGSIAFRLIGYEEHGLSIGGAVMCMHMNPDEVATTDLSALLIA